MRCKWDRIWIWREMQITAREENTKLRRADWENWSKQASIFPSLTYTNSTFNFVIHFYVEYLFLLRLNKPKRNINKNTYGSVLDEFFM